jgi:hypothetical protein
MPLDTAVNSIGEYYAAHYLEHRFVKDIAAPVKAWRELGSRGIPRRLPALGDVYFKAKAQALDGAGACADAASGESVNRRQDRAPWRHEERVPGSVQRHYCLQSMVEHFSCWVSPVKPEAAVGGGP